MKKLLPLLLIGILAATAASASIIYDDSKYIGCPKNTPGCPGYEPVKTTAISGSGPMVIRGSLGSTLAYRRDYSAQCWWKAGEGQVCGGQHVRQFSAEPKRFRREARLMKDDEDLSNGRTESQTLLDNQVSRSRVSGPNLIMSGSFSSFKWRGERESLRDQYVN